MPLPDTSNEQKLTYIYQTLKAQEARRKRHIFLRILKWILYISIIYLVYTYNEYIMSTLYKYTKDTINKEVRRVTEEQKAGILKGIQQLLPDLEKMSTPSTTTKSGSTTTKTGTGKTTPATTKTGTTTVKKK